MCLVGVHFYSAGGDDLQHSYLRDISGLRSQLRKDFMRVKFDNQKTSSATAEIYDGPNSADTCKIIPKSWFLDFQTEYPSTKIIDHLNKFSYYPKIEYLLWIHDKNFRCYWRNILEIILIQYSKLTFFIQTQ